MTAYPAEDAEAYERSLALLHRCLSPAGFLASPDDVDNYARIWARDGRLVGRVDALLWYVIGVCAYMQYITQADRERYRSSIEHALFLAGCWGI